METPESLPNIVRKTRPSRGSGPDAPSRSEGRGSVAGGGTRSIRVTKDSEGQEHFGAEPVPSSPLLGQAQFLYEISKNSDTKQPCGCEGCCGLRKRAAAMIDPEYRKNY